MQTQQNKPQEVWIKVLSKGIITIPKEFRKQLGIKEGEVAKARVEGNKLIIQSRETADYRLYTKKEIDTMVKKDRLSEPEATKLKDYWSDLP